MEAGIQIPAGLLSTTQIRGKSQERPQTAYDTAPFLSTALSPFQKRKISTKSQPPSDELPPQWTDADRQPLAALTVLKEFRIPTPGWGHFTQDQGD